MATVAEIMNAAIEDLRSVNADRSHLEARLLLGHCLQWSPEEVIQRDKEKISDAVVSKFKNLLQRRLAFEPIAYIVGEKEFFGLPFKVTNDVLIPRPETESLVQGALDWIQENEIYSGKILELGTGSGCIAISLAANLDENYEITATDVSDAALSLAKENAERNDQHSIKFMKADLLSSDFGLKNSGWNMIISNPPYIPTKEIPTLQPDILKFEPHLALEAGEDGLKFLKFILENAGKNFAKPGLLALETHGSHQIQFLTNHASELYPAAKLWSDGPHFFLEMS
jgi:release factor glutamine methyltransferase